jgi:multicomponent K+:H+ antiporter subunit A
MAAGIVDHETGTRDIRRLQGLIHAMPRTAILAMVATGAMAGVPLLNGFLSKEMFLAETVFVSAHPAVEWALPVLATVASAFAVVYSLRFGYSIFLGTLSTDLPRTPEEAPRWMRTPIQFLVLTCLAVGMAPALTIGPLLAAAAHPVLGGVLPTYSLAVWHGFTWPFLMSLMAIAGGMLGYAWLRRRQAAGHLHAVPLLSRWNARRIFEALLLGVTRIARRTVRTLGPRRLQSQLFIVLAVTLALAWAATHDLAFAPGNRPRLPVSQAFVALWAVGIICALGAAALAKYHRLVAVSLMGGAGLVTCLTFAWFSAPDLALTQLVVEVVTTTLFLLGLRWLPMRREDLDVRLSWRDRSRRARDLALAVVAGSGLAVLSFAFLTRPAPKTRRRSGR